MTVIDVVGQDDRSRMLKQTVTTQEGIVALLTPNGQRATKLNGKGVALSISEGQPMRSSDSP